MTFLYCNWFCCPFMLIANISSKNYFMPCLQHSDRKELNKAGPHGLIQRRNTEGSISYSGCSKAYVGSSLPPQGTIMRPEQEGECSTSVVRQSSLYRRGTKSQLSRVKMRKRFLLKIGMQDGKAKGGEDTNNDMTLLINQGEEIQEIKADGKDDPNGMAMPIQVSNPSSLIAIAASWLPADSDENQDTMSKAYAIADAPPKKDSPMVEATKINFDGETEGT